MTGEHPLGETPYRNYDPENVNTVEDAIELFEWLAEENRDDGNGGVAAVYDDCAELLETEVASDE